METPKSVDTLMVFEAGSINTIINDNHGNIYTNRSGEPGSEEEDEEEEDSEKVNDGAFTLTASTTGNELVCLLAAMLARRMYEYQGAAKFIAYICDRYPSSAIDNTVRRRLEKRMHDTLKNHDISIVRDQGSMLYFISTLSKQSARIEQLKRKSQALYDRVVGQGVGQGV